MSVAEKLAQNTDTNSVQPSSTDNCVMIPVVKSPWWYHLKYVLAGMLLGIVLVKGEMISWFRIQEMFRFQSFHMYGILATAVGTGAFSIFLIKKFNLKTIGGEPVRFPTKKFNKGHIYGGILFGLGWGMTGACPGPLFAQIGTGLTVIVVTLLSALTGTWFYGYVKEKLPH